ncbi:hypothetical protein EAX61_02090 [Dokdonia sinensis]|uniref:Glutaminyl-tRNA synthetase n=1 Tax=Dokdonia sinensis TaxID=2479847 RepID=A0A3M0GFE6_9FLAO|nr:DUF6327 family protein [Dokdonia sinensis]RMB63207.1 hypothetical protein EAX61_02090 [Dokdonia sinensis]
MRVYTNFDQIDQDLKILKLKKQIGEEELRLNINGAKSGLSMGFSPVSTIASMIGSILQKAVVAKLVSAIFGYKRVKDVDTGEQHKG